MRTDSEHQAPLYSVKFHQISGLVPPEYHTESAAAARRVAVDALRSGAAKRVEILDSSGSVILDLSGPNPGD
jgi:hypothetical protein